MVLFRPIGTPKMLFEVCAIKENFCQNYGQFQKIRRNLRVNKRVQNFILKKTISKFGSSNSSDGKRTKTISSRANKDNVENRDNLSNNSHPRRIHKQPIFSGEEGRRSASSNKFEESESICAKRALLNGGCALNPIYAGKGGLHVQTGLEGCLFQPSSLQKLSEICTLPVERETTPVHVPMFWIRTGTSNFYKTTESPTSSSPTAEYIDYNLHRRHVSYREKCEGGGNNKRQ